MTAGRVAFITCGALAREVLDIIAKHGWDAEIVGVPALDHMHPERIAPDVEKRFHEIKANYERVFVLFGDCGSNGALDVVCERFGLARLNGPHCYEFYGGAQFQQLMDEEPGTFFLTDFLLRGFEGLVIKGLGLDRYPELKSTYFGNYRRLVYLVQKEDTRLLAKAKEVAGYLDVPLEIRKTGYGLLEQRMVAMMAGEPQAADTANSAVMP